MKNRTKSMLKKKETVKERKCENTSNNISTTRKKKMAKNFPEPIKGTNLRFRKPNKSLSGQIKRNTHLAMFS